MENIGGEDKKNMYEFLICVFFNLRDVYVWNLGVDVFVVFKEVWSFLWEYWY